MTDQRLRMKMLRQVALHADNFYTKAETLGEEAAQALGSGKRSQINGLEGIANSALKTTDVLDFIKVRTARHKEWQKGGWGPKLLNFLSHDLRQNKQSVCSQLKIDDKSVEGMEVHLLLIREFVRQLAAHYEYACEFPEAGGHR